MFTDFIKKFSRKKIAIFSGSVLAILLVAALSIYLLSSDSTSAAVMRLEKVVGTVNLTDDSNNSLDILEGMRLTSGNALTTMEDSFAYISLDDTKSAKLDSLSSCIFVKDGNMIELDLLGGKLIFNVTEKLTDGELLNIKTSTMVSSIRGTSGFVEATDENNSTFGLMTGEVAISILNKATGVDLVARIYAGEKINITVNPDSGETTYDIVKITADDIPDYVYDAIEEDEDLRNEINEKDTEISNEIIGNNFTKPIESNDGNANDIDDNDDDNDDDDIDVDEAVDDDIDDDNNSDEIDGDEVDEEEYNLPSEDENEKNDSNHDTPTDNSNNDNEDDEDENDGDSIEIEFDEPDNNLVVTPSSTQLSGPTQSPVAYEDDDDDESEDDDD